MSNCYIQIDFAYPSILNAYEYRDSDSEEHSFDSSDSELIENAQKMQTIKVTVTKALEEIWRDEKKRRSRFKIRKPLEGVIDVSKNVEGTYQVQNGLKDPMWINFFKKG